MFNLSKIEHLSSLIPVLEKQKYKARLREKVLLSDSFVSLTYGKEEDFAQIKLIRKWKRIFGKYDIKILSSNIQLIDHLEQANHSEKKKTKNFNFVKKKFHKKLNSAIQAFRIEHNQIYSSKEKIEILNEKVSAIRFDPVYEDRISKFDFIKPAIGIEARENSIHPAFGITVGTNAGGGIFLFDPFEGQLEIGTFVNLGDISVYAASEFDLFDFSD